MQSQENSIVFKRVGGHSHDGITSTLLDTTKYSLFDFVPGTIAPSSTARGRIQNNNQNLIKNFIIQTVEERVLNPQGIAIKANTITSREISSGTITADKLSANLILVNNIIRSNNFNGSFFANGALSNSGTTGWAISNSGIAVFSNAILRGSVTANSGVIGGWTISSTQLRSNLTASTGLILDSSGGVSAYNNSNLSDKYEVILNTAGIFSSRNRSNQYSEYQILQTQNRHAEYFVNRGTNVSYIKQQVLYTTDYIAMSARTSESHTLGETVLLQTDFSGSNPLGRIRVKTTNTAGAILSYVNIGEGNGSVTASGHLVAGTYIQAGSTGITHTGSISATNWFRSSGQSGWYNETYGGGIWMSDSNVVRVYGSKLFYSSHGIESGSSVYASSYVYGRTYVDSGGTMSADDTISSLKNLSAGTYVYAGTYTDADHYFLRSGATSDGDYIIRNSSNGRLYIKSSLTELKENIENIDNSLDIINKLSPKKFNWKDVDNNDDLSVLTKKVHKTMGFLLEDVENISPSLVTWRKKEDGTHYPGYWKVDDFVALSIQGIKDLYNVIQDLQNEIKELKQNYE